MSPIQPVLSLKHPLDKPHELIWVVDNTVTFIILTCAEENVAIMCACFPLIASQFQYFSEKIHSRWKIYSSNRSASGGRPIRLQSRTKESGASKIQDMYTSEEQLHTGGASSRTVIRASSETNDSAPMAGKIFVRTDLESQ